MAKRNRNNGIALSVFGIISVVSKRLDVSRRLRNFALHRQAGIVFMAVTLVAVLMLSAVRRR
jgi:hypothetical protein